MSVWIATRGGYNFLDLKDVWVVHPKGYFEKHEVIAWMPLPVPYKGGRKMRLIDAERLHKELDCLAEFGDDVTIDDVIGIKKAMNVVTSQLTIEAEPVRHGEWVSLEADIGLFACSNCGHKILRAECNYCPNCGARMDKKSPENHKKYQEEETNKKDFK